MNLRPHRRDDPDINLVPMIDVVLVLLIFFMIATSLRHEAELDIRLPEASDRPMPTDLARLDVAVDAEGRYAVNGRPLQTTDAAALKSALQTAVGGRDLPLTLRADGRTPHQAVVTVLEIAAQLGLKQLAIATTAASPSVPPSPNPSSSPDPHP